MKKDAFRPGLIGRWGRFFSRLNFRRAEECSLVLRWLDPQPGERILDIGSGDGYYDWRISRSGARVTGIDIHKKRLAFARRHYSGERTEFLELDAERKGLPEGPFDKALSLCVLEHLEDDERVMKNLFRIMKPAGLLVFSVDSLSNPGIEPEERERHRKRYAVKTFYTSESMSEKLARVGFDVEETRYVLSSPHLLGLVRISWKLDDLKAWQVPIRISGYLVLGLIWLAASVAGTGRRKVPGGGLTLVIRARRRPR